MHLQKFDYNPTHTHSKSKMLSNRSKNLNLGQQRNHINYM